MNAPRRCFPTKPVLDSFKRAEDNDLDKLWTTMAQGMADDLRECWATVVIADSNSLLQVGWKYGMRVPTPLLRMATHDEAEVFQMAPDQEEWEKVPDGELRNAIIGMWFIDPSKRVIDNFP